MARSRRTLIRVRHILLKGVGLIDGNKHAMLALNETRGLEGGLVIRLPLTRIGYMSVALVAVRWRGRRVRHVRNHGLEAASEGRTVRIDKDLPCALRSVAATYAVRWLVLRFPQCYRDEVAENARQGYLHKRE